MPTQEMSDADVFGAPAPPRELSDADVFGPPPKPSFVDRAESGLADAGHWVGDNVKRGISAVKSELSPDQSATPATTKPEDPNSDEAIFGHDATGLVEAGIRRFGANAGEAFRQSVAGQLLTDAQTGALRGIIDQTRPNRGGQRLPTPETVIPNEQETVAEDKAAAAEAQREKEFANLPAATGPIGKGVALAGQLAGGMMSPENLIAPDIAPEINLGKNLVGRAASKFFEGAINQAPVAAAGTALADQLRSARPGEKPASYADLGEQVALGSTVGGLAHVAHAAVSGAFPKKTVPETKTVPEALATPTAERDPTVAPPPPVTAADLIDPEAAQRVDAAAPPLPADAAPAARYAPQFDLETNTFHVIGPDGNRVDRGAGYVKPEDAAAHAEMLNRLPPITPQASADVLPPPEPLKAQPSPESETIAQPVASQPAPPAPVPTVPNLTRQMVIDGQVHTINLPDENHAALFDYGQALERAKDGSTEEMLDPADIYARFKPWVYDEFRSARDVNNLAEDYLADIAETRNLDRDPDGSVNAGVVVDPDLEANYVRKFGHRGSLPGAPAATKPAEAPTAPTAPTAPANIVEPEAAQKAAAPSGRRNAAPPGSDGATADGRSTLLIPVPPRNAKTLMQWVRANGGIKDTGGDLAQMFRDNGRQPPPGIIANRNGQAADVLVQRAREAGYFPDVIDDEGRPDELTSDHLIGAIQDEINGTPRFSENDRMSVEAHDAAKAYNENIRNLAGLHGIDFRGTTLDAFHAAVAHSEMKMRAEDLGIVLKGDESPAKVAALVHEKELSQSSPEQYAAQADAIDRYLDARFGTDLPDALDDLPWADEDAHTAAKAGVSQGEASRPSEGGPGREKPDGPAAERDGTGPVGEGRGRDDDTGVGGEQSPHATEADDQNGLGFGESAKIKDWPAELARVRARAEQWRSTAARLSEPRAVRFQHPNGLAALTGPDVSKPGGFRATYFRDGDPVGHVEFPTHRDAIYDTLREGFRPTEESALQRGPGGMAPLRAALKSGNIKRGAQAVIDRMRLQAGLDDSYNIKNPDRARPAIDRADIREVENFIDFIGHHMFDDVGLRILKGGEGGTLGQYNAYNHIVSLFREAVAGGDVSRTMVHELWHSLERVLPRGDYAAVTREYLNQQRKWLAKNEWARPFLANGELQDRLTGAKGEAWLNEHEADPAAMRNVEVLTNDKGEKIGAAIRWTSDNYRFKNREEYWAETMADKYFNAADLEDAKARSVFGHVRAIYNQMVDGVKRAFGGDATGRIFEGFRDHDYSPGENPDNPYVAGQYDVRRTPTTERTDQGDQFVMPGTERSAVQAAAARGDKATTAAKQKPADFGLFAQPEKPQPSLFDPPKPAKTAPAEEGLPAAKAVETKLDPHQRAADFVIQKGKQDGNEHMVIIDPVSQLPLASTSDGRVDGVSIPASIMVKIADPNERLVIHHNHPGGTALSTPDATLLHFPGLSWIVAHTHDGEFSGARLTDAARAWALSKPSILRALAIKNMATRAYNQTVAMAREAYNAGKATSSDLNAVVSEFTQRALHAAGLTEYVSSHDTSFIPQELHDQIVNSAANAVKIESRRYGINLADADRPAEPVRPKEAIGRLPGSDDVDPQAVATGNSGRDQGGKEGAQYATKQPPPIPDRRGQYALLESTSPQELRESPSAKEVFDRAAATIASSRGPMRTPERLARAVSETAKDSVLGRVVRRVVTPGAFDDTAKIAARGIRQVFGQMYVNDLQAAHALKKGEEALDKMSTAEKNAFAMAIDEGGKQATPELQAIADNLRRETQKATSRLQALGILEDARENYLGRIWKPRGQAVGADTSRAVLAALSNKTPLKGPASFLKQRHYDTYREALAAGLEPQFDNPIRTQLVKISEMNRFYAGALVSDGAKKSGLAKFFSHLGDVPEGWVRLEGPEFKRPQMRIKHEDGETSFVPEGNWYAPEGFARVMNNFQSRGLKGTVFAEPAEYLRAASNAMNSFQLGVSAFHPVFTSLDAQFSRVGIGIDQAMRGEFGKAAGNILGGISPTNWYTNIKAGDDFLKMILDPSNATPEQQRLVNAFGSAGGRVFMQRVLAPTDEGMIKVWKSGAFGRAIRDANAKYPGSPIRATLNVVGRTLETTSAPVMDYVVPRQKLGVFSRLAKDWIDSHPDATNTEFVAAMQDRWDSVDNRLGQMVYDNLFWDKTLKDIAFITTRSVGWNLGSMREIGGGLADAGKFLYNAAALNSPQWTHRMSYLMALTTGSMMMGAMINYMFTGQAPHELKDYFYPRTGLMRTDGMPDRMQLPTYMKDVFAYSHDPFKTLANKESPLLSFINQLVSGHDYYGDLIANKDDPIMKQVEDVMGFAASQFVPFSFQGTYRMFKERPGPTAAMGMLGFTPAPGYIANPMREQMYEQKQHKADATKTVHGQARRNIIAPLKPMPPQERAAGGRVQHDQAAAMADPNPTVPQIEANNYRHGHLRVHGLDVSIETAKGGVRKGVGKDGKPWKVTMPSHYGYFKGTVGADSEHVDCFVGFFPKATHVYVVDQLDPETREFDEHKCLVFFPSLTSALTAYRRSYSDGKGERRIGNVRTMSIAEFKDWLKHGDTTRSIAA